MISYQSFRLSNDIFRKDDHQKQQQLLQQQQQINDHPYYKLISFMFVFFLVSATVLSYATTTTTWIATGVFLGLNESTLLSSLVKPTSVEAIYSHRTNITKSNDRNDNYTIKSKRFSLSSSFVEADVISVTKTIPMTGSDNYNRIMIRYHYAPQQQQQQMVVSSSSDCTVIKYHNILLLGVGTSMSVSDYDEISKRIVYQQQQNDTTSTVVIVIDAQPGYPFKNNVQYFTNSIIQIIDQLSTLITPIDCSNDNNHSYDSNTSTVSSNIIIIIGGHSAGGMTSYNSILHHSDHYKQNNITIDGYFGLDPYYIPATTGTNTISSKNKKQLKHSIRSIIQPNPGNNTVRHDYQQQLHYSYSKATYNDNIQQLTIPSLYWGLLKTTCYVQTTNAALAAYNRSNPKQRILYQIQNNNDINDIDIVDHCCFTDNGCMGCSSLSNNIIRKQYIWDAISLSYNAFVTVLIQTIIITSSPSQHSTTTTKSFSHMVKEQQQQQSKTQDVSNNHDDNTTTDTNSQQYMSVNSFDEYQYLFEEIQRKDFHIDTKLFYGS
jgi:hypothetical protein